MEHEKYLEEAAEILGVPETELTHFEDTPDVFNEGNTVSGFLCRRSDYRYGALCLYAVNGIDTGMQVIYCTPKLRYPFGRTDAGERIYHFPQDVIRGESYEKYDGTNICAYGYSDADGGRYVTFKTRLTPILRSSRFGDFVGLWNEILDRYPFLRRPDLIVSGELTFSFEMFGYRNPVTIAYDTALEVKLLFGVHQIGEHPFIIPPSHFDRWLCGPYDAKAYAKVLPELVASVSGEDMKAQYEATREQDDKLNEKREDGMITGTEGKVWYILTREGWLQYKVKPPSIERVHWVAGSLPKEIVLMTAWNALESCGEELTSEYIKELLLEEFTPAIIEKSATKIEKAIKFVTKRALWRQRVLDAFQKVDLEFSEENRPDIMRQLSKYFKPDEMKAVFVALRELGIAK